MTPSKAASRAQGSQDTWTLVDVSSHFRVLPCIGLSDPDLPTLLVVLGFVSVLLATG